MVSGRGIHAAVGLERGLLASHHGLERWSHSLRGCHVPFQTSREPTGTGKRESPGIAPGLERWSRGRPSRSVPHEKGPISE